ncbi:PilZ domain-containing protein [Methylovirgula sp. HY1]|uniref:PilZ domain-containing protein n=1 Tax=Methylovirgula sp. HY1 TaxID=2822761 RepID=UPI001C5BB5F7|nr:PilZ domain-containing protein [Methylovirgula sp. HY1]QXX74114.1 hypothetical protein MHY1_00922 [Methylovirgula sp. HY1]
MDTDMKVPETGMDKRANDRIRSFLRAQIIFNNRMTTIDCIVKNISQSGARVALNDTLAVPTEFDIYIPQRGRSHHAKLVWRDKDSIGVDFIDAQPAPPPTPAAPAPAEMSAFGEARIRELEVQNAELKIRIRELSKRLQDLGQEPDNTM